MAPEEGGQSTNELTVVLSSLILPAVLDSGYDFAVFRPA
jgi:hypothetical protein